MKRWIAKTRTQGESYWVDNLLNEIVDVCKMHGYILDHQDTKDTFFVKPYDNETALHILNAEDFTYEEKNPQNLEYRGEVFISSDIKLCLKDRLKLLLTGKAKFSAYAYTENIPGTCQLQESSFIV